MGMSVQSRLRSGLDRPGVTVTSFVEHLVGESICAVDRRHVPVTARCDNDLELATGETLVQRSAVLRGIRSSKPYLYAETLLAPSRLPVAFMEELEESCEPIGRLLATHGIRFSRKALPLGRTSRSVIRPEPPPSDHIWARRYQVTVEAAPVMVIGEWFLPSLRPFLRPTFRRDPPERTTRLEG